jgi:hypothetical protein
MLAKIGMAWSSDEILILEYACIQDLMNHAVHASYSTLQHSAATKLRRILSFFHDQKKQAGVCCNSERNISFVTTKLK